ncbi:DUF2235 domain-containing protein [Methylorubrum extorquens]|uniref:T6SS Phospholipase effector Tle1-like catalytic domain-containing protein n=1 Tax=Methylorubrum extorquens (strain CM4 / NCIMB 13688) TaxID=440085 RepID=B7L3I0_METC4|nr:DUF2235 domain-containing protein [Methylorubrum extorquens]ACK86388.1 conserved hypothetical protein [Methylorubrum extorquens CM4]
MPKNIVICCDGTGNEIGETISNVLKLYRILEKDDTQRVYYSSGIGTIGYRNAWQRLKQETRGVFGLATGYGLDEDVLAAYRFLCDAYEDGDRVWLFGFSRGAYTVRALAGFINVIGLLRPDQVNLAGYAFAAYKQVSVSNRAPEWPGEPAKVDNPAMKAAWQFARIAGAYPIRIEFIGVWDTVASIIAPRKDRLFPTLQTLPYTRVNPCVKAFRQAIAIDECRRMFRLNRWGDRQPFRKDPYERASVAEQDVRQVWFAGVHADIGGGYPEAQSGISKFPLLWMVRHAQAKGLRCDRRLIDHLVLGISSDDASTDYVPPDVRGKTHDSMNAGWRILEWLPKKARWREWPARKVVAGFYLPRAEPRRIPDGARIHWSVFQKMEQDPGYKPLNLPDSHLREEDLAPPEL